jgi:hypothetical protein
MTNTSLIKMGSEGITRLSAWITIHDYCATRVIEGTDPNQIENRVAFIEKTPRVRIRAEDHQLLEDLPDFQEGNIYLSPERTQWYSGPKGSGGSDPEGDQCYGFDPESREWCEGVLLHLGYELLKE